uniref:type I protein arginine methyltransferase n=1 Tax=Oryza punctata TaxID=4537 RepID=A0A0E0LNX6_ORYPU
MATRQHELHPKQERLGEDREEYEDGEEEEEGEEGWDDWESDGDDAAGGGGGELLCLFCSARFDSESSLFSHCASEHRFDFYKVVKETGMDFYGCIKLINFVRSKVAENKCWSCGQAFSSNGDLCGHLHALEIPQLEGKVPWGDDVYLKPFMEDDSVLHSLSVFDDDEEEDCGMPVEKGEYSAGNGSLAESCESNLNSIINDGSDVIGRFEKTCTIESTDGECSGSLAQEPSDKQLKIARASAAARGIKSVDEGYFGSYSSFGIHREMLGDKVRTEAYRDALLGNPSLMNGATVLDVGCGTGILSLFAAKAGASRVIAVDGSAKMVSVATQVAKNNGFLYDGSVEMEQKQDTQVISVVHTKAEELNHKIQVPSNKFDVLVSEWMGYCLLYESMLSSVLYARDHFLKPGGAILPDTATIFGAGFGKGGTSLPFWENVYGFDMSCIGKEVTGNSARFPVVDILASEDIVTETAVLHEKPVNLSTSPFSTPTHWSQTIFTFEEPIAMAKEESAIGSSASVGTEECPAVTIRSRISIVRASEHRSIDISIETMGTSSDGRKRSWPVQIFNL